MSDLQNPPAYAGSPAPQPDSKRGNGFGVTALILGILTIVGFAIPFANYVAIATGVAGIVFAIIGLIAKNRTRGTSIAGLVLSVIGLILSIIMVVVYSAIFFAASKAVDDTNKAAATEHTVVYTVTGDSTDSSITWATSTDGDGGSEQASGAKLPWTKEVKVKGSSKGLNFNSFTVTASNGTTGGEITCEIKVDGKVVSTKSASGEYASATCSGSN
ncbi:DUF4190 domain-containing protein [Curtobacterium sp. L1-20]|uniref:DUF4190 domain-containing protein n=1 Tax=Curtobacterium sp. L1-20 TaxID=3138181 RepID=UPI003B5169F9